MKLENDDWVIPFLWGYAAALFMIGVAAMLLRFN